MPLREISLKRKASGGKAMGMFGRPSINNKDDKLNMVNAEKILAYDPGNTDYMQAILQNAHKAGFFDAVMWIGPILLRANKDSGAGGKSFLGSGFGGGQKESFDKYIILKNIYKDLGRWKLAAEAADQNLGLRD